MVQKGSDMMLPPGCIGPPYSPGCDDSVSQAWVTPQAKQLPSVSPLNASSLAGLGMNVSQHVTDDDSALLLVFRDSLVSP